jgi:hypothetical protein
LISFLQKKRQRNSEDERFLNRLDRELAEGFPNPNRVGCPDAEILQRLARHQIPIAEIDPWIDHLGSCSQCFGDFNRLKVAFRRRRRQQFVLYGAVACIVLASAGFLWRQASRGRDIAPRFRVWLYKTLPL